MRSFEIVGNKLIDLDAMMAVAYFRKGPELNRIRGIMGLKPSKKWLVVKIW